MTDRYTDPNQPMLDVGLGLLKMTLARTGLSPEFVPRVWMHPSSGEIAITLSHTMCKPSVNESFADVCNEIEDAILDSDLVEEVRASLDSELYQANQQIRRLQAENADLRQYKTWYILEQQLLEVTCISSTKQDSNENEELVGTWTVPSGTLSQPDDLPLSQSLEYDSLRGSFRIGYVPADNTGSISLPQTVPSTANPWLSTTKTNPATISDDDTAYVSDLAPVL